MKKNVLLFSFASLLVCNLVKAQFNYDITVLQQTYQPLAGATSINGSMIWDDEVFMMPIGFNFQLDQKNISDIAIITGTAIATDTEDVVDMFLVAGADMYDRGNVTGMGSLSPVRYKVEGASGSRIFKLEVANAGFYDEWDIYSTDNDSVNYQVWLYEASNVVELRFGPSNISHPADYFLGTGKPVVGFFRQYDLYYDSTTAGYLLTGNPAAPVVDSIKSLDTIDNGLNTYPPNGTVYKFSPKPVNVRNVNYREPAVKLLSNIDNKRLTLVNSESIAGRYKILSSIGKDVEAGDIYRGNTTIDISLLPAGNYVIHSVLPTGSKVMRFTKCR